MTSDAGGLVFVYNADSGLTNAALDSLRKLVAPDRYQCNLCRLTYGAVRPRSGWLRFLRDLRVDTTFLHRDEFRRAHPEHVGTPLPAAFVQGKDGALSPLLPAAELQAVESLDELERLVLSRLGDECDP